MGFAKFVVKHRVLILVFVTILMVPAAFGFFNTPVNYDMLTYLPSESETVIGQQQLVEDFGRNAFSFIIFENMSDKDVAKVKTKIQQIECVDFVLWYDSLLDTSIPAEILPDKLYETFYSENSTLMIVFFKTGNSDDVTMKAVEDIRNMCKGQCFISGMTAMVLDMKLISEREEITYAVLGISAGLLAMMLFLDGWLLPFVFLASIGAMILLNMGSNYFLGQISYITKAIAAVLQLAVTMDYSIFLWHNYNEQREVYGTKEEAMAHAIVETFSSILGSAVTTIAGFIALCFMSFTMGKDLGIVMAKGVLFGVIGCVTLLPSVLLMLDKPLQRTRHKTLTPNPKKLSKFIVKVFPLFFILFLLLVYPSFDGYKKANNEVYYDMSSSMPRDMDYAIATKKLREDYGIASTHIIMVSASTSSKDVKSMIKEMEKTDGIMYVLGVESLLGPRLPDEIFPDDVLSLVKSDRWKLLLANSVYIQSSDEVNAQIDTLAAILAKYDPDGMIIGEAPCMKDMIETTGRDFKVVTYISVIAIFLIIMLVTRSLTLPVILIAVIELGIFINLGLPHYLGQSMSFMTPICISTIQLGSTIDYAILLTTRYKTERMKGKYKRESVWVALYTSIPSIIVSSMVLFAATIGVGLYSDIDIVSSMCMLMARGAVISMLLVVFILPSMFVLFDRVICKTTLGMGKVKFGKEKEGFDK